MLHFLVTCVQDVRISETQTFCHNFSLSVFKVSEFRTTKNFATILDCLCSRCPNFGNQKHFVAFYYKYVINLHIIIENLAYSERINFVKTEREC